MAVTDRLDQLYDALSKDGAQLPKRDVFRKNFLADGDKGYQNRKAFWQALKDDGAEVGNSYEEFRDALGLHGRKKTYSETAKDIGAQKWGTQTPKDFGKLDTRTIPANRFTQVEEQPESDLDVNNLSDNAKKRVQSYGQQAMDELEYEKATGKKLRNQAPLSITAPTVARDEKGEMLLEDGQPLVGFTHDEDRVAAHQEMGVKRNLAERLYGTTKDVIEQKAQEWGETFKKNLGRADFNDLIATAFATNNDKNLSNDAKLESIYNTARELFGNEDIQKQLDDEARSLGMSPEDYREQVSANLEGQARDMLHQLQLNEALPKNAGEYIVRGILDSVIGGLTKSATLSREQRDILNEADALTEEGEGVYKPGTAAEISRFGTGLLMDATAFQIAGEAAGATVRTMESGYKALRGTQLATRIFGKAAPTAAEVVQTFGRRNAGNVMRFLAANTDDATRLVKTVVPNTLRSALSLGYYENMKYNVSELPMVVEDGIAQGKSFMDIADDIASGEAGSFLQGAKTGAEFGFASSFLGTLGAKIGVTGREATRAKAFLHGTEKAAWKLGSFAVEAGIFAAPEMYEKWQQGKDVNVVAEMAKGAGMAIMSKINGFVEKAVGGPQGKEKGNFIGRWIRKNTGVNIDPNDPLTLSMEERQQFNNSLTARRLYDQLVEMDRVIDYDPKGMKQITGLDEFFADKENNSWELRAKIMAALGDAIPASRPRMETATVTKTEDGYVVDERALDNELISRKTFKTEDDAETYISVKKDTQLYNDVRNYYQNTFALNENERKQVVEDFINSVTERSVYTEADVLNMLADPESNMSKMFSDTIRQRMKEKMRLSMEAIYEYEADNDVSVVDLLRKNPVELTEEERQQLIGVRDFLDTLAYKPGELHVEQSALRGRQAAQEAGMGTDFPNVEMSQAEKQRFDEAKAEFDKLDESIRQEVEEGMNQGGRPSDILDSIVFSNEDERVVVAEYFNSMARWNDFLQGTMNEIEERVRREIQARTLQGTVNGENITDRMVMVSDGGFDYTLLNGNVRTDDSGRIIDAEGGVLICMDASGEIFPLGTDRLLTVRDGLSFEEFGNQLREVKQEDATEAIGATEPKSEEKPEGGNETADTGEGVKTETIPGRTAQLGTERGPGITVDAEGHTVQTDGNGQPVGETPLGENQVKIEDITDNDGVKHYEQGIDHDTAIQDLNNDGIDPGMMADAMIREAQEKIDKWAKKKNPKPSDLVKAARETKDANSVIEYWTQLKERYEEQKNPEKTLKVESEDNNEGQSDVTLQPKAATKSGESAGERRARLFREAKNKYGDYFDDTDFPQDELELAAWGLGKGMLKWEGKGGLQDHMGKDKKRGIGKKYDTNSINYFLAPTGEGKTVEQIAHEIAEGELNPVVGDGRMYDSKEIMEAMLELIRGAGKPTDILDYVYNRRVEAAKKLMESQRETEEDAKLRGEEPVTLTDEELRELEKDLPFDRGTGEDIPDSPITKLEKEAAALMAEEGTPAIRVVDTERMSDDAWQRLAEKAYDDAFIGEEEIEQVKRDVLEGRIFFNKETGEITVFSTDVTPEELRETVSEIKKYLENDRIHRQERQEEENLGNERDSSDAKGEEERKGSQERDGGQSDGNNERREPDEYLKPRNDKEKEIISDVEKKLADEIKVAEENVRKAKSELEKARAKESDKATDMFSDDETRREDGQLFGFDEMPTDRTQEGVNKRTEEQRGKLNAAEKELERLKSKAEHDSRVRGALDNERRQTKIQEPEAAETISEIARNEVGKSYRYANEENVGKIEFLSFDEKKGTVKFRLETYDRRGGGREHNEEGEMPLDRFGIAIRNWKAHDVSEEAYTTRNKQLREEVETGKKAPVWNNPLKAAEEIANEERKKKDEEIGITRNETPEQKAQAEGDRILSDENPLTEEEINNSNLSGPQKTWAKSYLRGKRGELETEAYLEAYEDVRNRRQDNEADRQDADRTQLVGTDDKQERGPGQPGEQAVELAAGGDVPVEGGERTEPGRVPSVEDSKDNVSAPVGERGDSSVPRTESEVDRLPSGGEQPVRGSGTGSNGRNVRGTGADQRSSRVAGQAKQRDIKAKRAELKSKRDELLAKLKALKEQNKKDSSGKLNMAVLPPIPSGISSYIPKDKEQRKVFWELATTTAEYGYTYLEEGITKFNDWKNKVFEDFVEPIKDFFGWGQNEVDHYIEQVWNSDYEINGETRTMSEWASLLEPKELRNIVKSDLEAKFEAQKAAESIEVKVGDIDNIRETLPYLLPEQQDDVLKAETQFFDEKHSDREHGYGKGMMFTNGTGTGKTYTGLGIVKRFVRQGKGRVLILTPSQEKVEDWRRDGRNLGLELESLDEDAKNLGVSATKAKGKGVVVTTYANARQNLKMLEDCFDLVVYDESHKIMESKEATGTTMNFFHEMLTNKNVERSVDRQTYYLPEWVEMRNLRKEESDINTQLMELENATEQTAEQEDLIKRLNARMLEISARKQELFPIMEEIRKSKVPQAEIDSKRTKAVFLSATPFNVRESLRYAEGYLFSFPEENKNTIGSYNHRSPEDAFFEQMFPAGYRWRYGRLEHHVSNAEALGRQEIDFSDYLQNTLQTMSGRMIASDYDYSRDFPVLTLDNAGRFNQAMNEIYRNRRYNALSDAFRKSFDYNYSTALFEAMKTSLVNDRIKEHLARGQKVVVFHRRRTSGDLEPPFRRALNLAEAQAEQAGKDGDKKTMSEILSAIAAFEKDFADILEWEKTIDYTLPREQIEKVFGKDKIAFFSGAENKKTKHQSVEDFMKDNGGKDIIVIQEASGKEGISLHDQTGEHQRVEINLALPQSPIAFIQIEGRIYRIGQKSNAIFEYPLLGLDLETSLFAQRFNNALGTTENLALGSKARNLRKSIASSVLENTGEVDYDRQGLGGKDMDGRVAGSGGKDGFDVSIQDYYGNQKMQRGRDNREGVDYFPTPEPIGYKMVEWAQLTEGETALEPSAGHGAIARYVPETNGMTAIEPSASLFTRLQMRAGGPGRRFEDINFEDYPLSNKHDTVLMNPPYGVGGKTAIEHVAKAFRHLNEGGRLIAIIPDGPAMERRFDAWINNPEMKGAAVLVGEVKLPGVTFGRAGTSVMTRIVVVDKVTRKEMRDGMSSMESYDLSREESIGGLLDRIRNIRMPERTIDAVAINEKKAKKTERSLKDNPFTSTFNISGNMLHIESKSRRDMPSVYIDLENPNIDNILNLYNKFKGKAEHPENVDYGKWADKNFGRGENKVNGLDAIRDFCEGCIKTLENISGLTRDQMDRTIREREEARIREEQERKERIEREERERQQRLDSVIATLESEFKGDSNLPNLKSLLSQAHKYNGPLGERAKKLLRQLGVDWETGKEIPTPKKNLQKAYNEQMPLDLDTMEKLMTIAETTIDGARKRAAQSALEMSGIHSETGEAKENFDFSSHDKYYEDELRSFLHTAGGPFTEMETKQQRTEREKAEAEQRSNPASGYEYKLDKNTRTGEDMHLVTMKNRLGDTEYKAVERRAKANGGYYNRFKKAWHFPSEADAKKFIDGVGGEVHYKMRADAVNDRGVHYKFAESQDEFDDIRNKAVKENGIVIKGLRDKKVTVTKVPKHDFVGTGKEALKEAEKWGKENLSGLHKGIDSYGNTFDYTISNRAIGKYLSEKATSKSNNIGVHLSVFKELPEVIGNSIEVEVHPDYLKDENGEHKPERGYNDNVLVHRFYGAIDSEGRIYRVKTTILEYRDRNRNNKAHSYEVTKIELMDDKSNSSWHPTVELKSSVDFANILKDVEKSYDKGKKVLDESEKVPQTPSYRKSYYATEVAEAEPADKVRRHIDKISKNLNVSGEMKLHENVDDITNAKVREDIKNGKPVLGWFEESDNSVHLYMPNIKNRYEAEATIRHEFIGHKGLREFLGDDNYKTYMRELWMEGSKIEAWDKDLRDYVKERLPYHNFDLYDTIDEYLSEAAEEKNWDNTVVNLLFKVRNSLENVLSKMGFDEGLSIREVGYMLWLSKNRIKGNDPLSEARRNALRYRLERKSIEMPTYDNGRSYLKDDVHYKQQRPYHPGSTPTANNARDWYHHQINRTSYVWTEAYVDYALGLKKAMEAIAGTDIMNIKDSENAYLAENHMSSIEQQKEMMFVRNHLDPLQKSVNELLPDLDSDPIEALSKLESYMQIKHGLERNREFLVRDHLKAEEKKGNNVDQLRQDWEDEKRQARDELRNGNITYREYLETLDDFIRDNVNDKYDPDNKDYSGLKATGMSDSDAIDHVLSTESKLGTKVHDFWERVKDVTNYSLDEDYNNGLISKANRQTVGDMFEYYVPLRGFKEEVAHQVYDYLGIDVKNPVSTVTLMKAKGRKSIADSPIATMCAMATGSISRGTRNRVKQRLLQFVRNHDGQNLITESKVWLENVGTEQAPDWVVKYPDIPENATADEVAKIVKDFNDDMTQKEANGMARVMRSNLRIPYRTFGKEKSQHIVEVSVGGEKHLLIVNGNPRAAQVMNGLMNPSTADGWEWLDKINRFMSSAFTTWNPTFVASNTFRDAIFSRANIATKENARYLGKYIGNYWGKQGRAFWSPVEQWGSLWKKYREGTLNDSEPVQRYFKEFMENGGETGFVALKNVDKWKEIIASGVSAVEKKNKVEKLVGKGEQAAKFVFSIIEDFNERAENLARFNTYMTSRQMGRSILRSITDAKEVSVNFNRKGAGRKTKGNLKGSAFAGLSAEFMRKGYLFFNAGMQSLAQVSRNLKKHPVKFSSYQFGIHFLGGMMIPLINGMLAGNNNDEEAAENPYANLPEWTRRNNLCFYVGGNDFITIPLPIELRAFYGLGDIAAGFVYDKELQSTKPVGEDIAAQLTQILPVDFMGEGGSVGAAMVPDAIKPLSQIARNTDWTGKPLQKENTWNDLDPEWTKAYRSTNKVMVNFTRNLSNWTGGDDVKPGFINLSPAYAMNLLNGYLGGMGKTFADAGGFVQNLVTMDWEDFNARNVPIAKALYKQSDDRTAYYRTRAKFYKYVEDAKKTEHYLNGYKKDKNDPVKTAKYIRMLEGPEGQRVLVLKEFDKQLKKIRSMEKNATPEARKNLETLEYQIQEQAVKVLENMK